MELASQHTIKGGIVAGFFGGAQAGEPIGGRSEAVGIVVKQRVLGGEPAFDFVKFSGAARGNQECLEERDLAVLIEIGLWIGDGLGEILTEAGVVLLEAAAGGGDDDAIGSGQLIEKGRAGGSGVDDCERTVKGLKPERQFSSRCVGPAQVEPGLFAIERAMTD